MHVIYRSGRVFFSWLPYNVLYIKTFTANLLVFVQSVYNFIRTVKRLVQAGLLIGHSVWGFSSKTWSLPVICRIIIHSEHIQRNAIVLKWRLVFHPPPPPLKKYFIWRNYDIQALMQKVRKHSYTPSNLSLDNFNKIYGTR